MRWPLPSMLAAVLLFHAAAPSAASVSLANTLWRVVIDPSTLATRVEVAGQRPLEISEGGRKHDVTLLMQDGIEASWQWDADASLVSVRLEGDDLYVDLRATRPGDIVVVHQPGPAMGEGLVLPLAEGHYVPRGNRTWRRFLTRDGGHYDLAEDLSLPLWGNQHGNIAFSWIVPESFDNRLRLKADGDGLAVTLTHRFTPLNQGDPLRLILHKGPGTTDLLDGAKRYRTWLQRHGRFESLAEKIARTPATERLPGATHAYLWGNGLLSARDVADWPGFMAFLRSEAPLAIRLRSAMDTEGRARLHQAAPTAFEQRQLVTSVNAALAALARQRWMHAEPDMSALRNAYAQLRGEMAAAAGTWLARSPADWGGGLSTTTLSQLRQAGLPRLWLGLGDGWEGGLWHPEAVGAAVAAGYLVAPYDSYETALPPTGDAAWTTAHLGSIAFDRCGIVRADGSKQPGFQGDGAYTDPRCVRPMMIARSNAIRAAVPFNSWFLDTYATAMTYESYRAGHLLSRRASAENQVDNMRWFQDSQRMPLGSEGGNAGAARGLAFAHGMQTPVIGWGDADMGRGVEPRPGSPWFVGPWYPADQPAVFFAPVPLKKPYVTIHFDPRFRLPLYQAVFHDSVVTTHHWLIDTLKPVNVRRTGELTQLLYNVPPLYHLSEGTLQARLPFIVRQDAFFRPLHRRLAGQPMLRFEWLTPDHTLQKTTFGDGSALVANFAARPRAHGGHVYPACSVTGHVPGGMTTRYEPLPDTE